MIADTEGEKIVVTAAERRRNEFRYRRIGFERVMLLLGLPVIRGVAWFDHLHAAGDAIAKLQSRVAQLELENFSVETRACELQRDLDASRARERHVMAKLSEMTASK